MRCLQPTATAALSIIAIAAMAQQEPAQGGIGYPSVAAALEALKARPDVKISAQNGWTIVDDRATGTLWSFTPPNHPAHPAAVKRTVVERAGEVFVEMSALCQASKVACDKLIAEFRDLNEAMVQAMRRKVQSDKRSRASDIQVERLGDDSYRLVLRSFRSNNVDAGQEELLPKAREVCSGRNVRYGKYEFEISEPVIPPTAEKRPLLLRQEIHCGGTTGPPITPTRPDLLWRPTLAQEDLIKRQTYAYFSAKDSRKYQEAYSLFSPSQQQTISFEPWSSSAEDFNSRAGAVRSRSIKKITWYKDPPRSAPGIYAAVDFASEFANIEIHCGYIAWHMQEDGSFRLVREEQNFIDRTMQQKLKEGELDKLRAQFGAGCK